MPIDDGVIQRVEQLAEIEKQPVLVDANPLFEWTPGVSIEEDNIEELGEENIEELEDVIQEEAINIEVDENENEKNIEEGVYITDVDSISEN